MKDGWNSMPNYPSGGGRVPPTVEYEAVSKHSRAHASGRFGPYGGGGGYGADGSHANYANDHTNKTTVPYMVSALLHKRYREYFYDQQGLFMKFLVIVDFVFHLLLWLFAFGIDIWIFSKDLQTMWLRELHVGAFVCLLLAFLALLCTFVFGVFGQGFGQLWPCFYGLMYGGLVASILFSTVFAIELHSSWPAALTATDASADPPWVTIRQLTVWVIGLKTLAFFTLKANQTFNLTAL